MRSAHGSGETGRRCCKRTRCSVAPGYVQALGKVPINVNELNVDLASFSGHKVCTPKEVEVLFIKERD
ncbi:MAG: aminotransferase class V-fold PLP-dependent enzyme [Syntrophobacterales bacterium]|nr:aminotransferase class V-fold PLP-dependent enzyme [Syntrophobacterales bacterium]